MVGSLHKDRALVGNKKVRELLRKLSHKSGIPCEGSTDGQDFSTLRELLGTGPSLLQRIDDLLDEVSYTYGDAEAEDEQAYVQAEWRGVISCLGSTAHAAAMCRPPIWEIVNKGAGEAQEGPWG